MARTKPYQVLGADVIGKLMAYARSLPRSREKRRETIGRYRPSPIIETARRGASPSASLSSIFLSLSLSPLSPCLPDELGQVTFAARGRAAIIDESRSLVAMKRLIS